MKMNKIIKFAVIGCGRIGNRHAEHISNLGSLVAVCDIDQKKANELGEKYNAERYTNISDLLEKESSVTYPSKSPTMPGEEIVFGDKFPNETGRGKFVPASVTSPNEVPDQDYQLILTTGRQLEHWHTGAMTRKASNLDALEPEATVSISPNEILKNNMKPGDQIKVSTRRGSVNIRVREDRAIPEGVIFIPFCYNEAAANLLTNPALDPYGKIPEFKYCAAKIEKIR